MLSVIFSLIRKSLMFFLKKVNLKLKGINKSFQPLNAHSKS